MKDKDKEYLLDLAEIIDSVSKHGADKDEPEINLWIQISEKLRGIVRDN